MQADFFNPLNPGFKEGDGILSQFFAQPILRGFDRAAFITEHAFAAGHAVLGFHDPVVNSIGQTIDGLNEVAGRSYLAGPFQSDVPAPFESERERPRIGPIDGRLFGARINQP